MIRRILFIIIVLFTLWNLYMIDARADSVSTVAADLRAACDIPFRYGVAQSLAANLLTAQSLAAYAGAESLELSIESVLRAIAIDAQHYVGFADTCPITWLQSNVAIDPSATVGITPSAIYFGEAAVVVTPEPLAIVMLMAALLVTLVIVFMARNIFKLAWTFRKPPKPPIILTEFGPVTEWARKQAVVNMREDTELRAAVFQVVLNQCQGDEPKAIAEFSRRYPELGGTRVDYNAK